MLVVVEAGLKDRIVDLVGHGGDDDLQGGQLGDDLFIKVGEKFFRVGAQLGIGGEGMAGKSFFEVLILFERLEGRAVQGADVDVADQSQALVKDIAMHVAASAPTYVSKDEVPAETTEKEKEIYREQAKAQGKPDKVIDRIAEGRLKDYYSSFCLLEQPFIWEPKQSVGQLVQEQIAIIKENIVVRRFARFKLGEAPVAEAASSE